MTKINSSIPNNDSGARGIDYTLQVANKFDDMVIIEQLCLTYQNHVLDNNAYKPFWSLVIVEIKN